VAWARGFRADVQVGDEPMCEFVDAATLAQLRAGDTLVVTLSEQKIRLSLIRPE
jgi:endonuclease YncB( thermonuclease family)